VPPLHCGLVSRPRQISANGPSGSRGIVARAARWCVQHRRRALVAWVALLVVVLGVSGAVGTRQANQFSLPR
jgi:hypothetical protein